MKLTAFHLKLALMEYYRFRRQYICVDEFNGADIIVDTGSSIIEVEIKVDRSDLRRGEDKKVVKHDCYRRGISYHRCHPNKYLFCVPTSLREVAEKTIQTLNPKYGLILFDEARFHRFTDQGWPAFLGDLVCTVKRAGKLHAKYSDKQSKLIAKRTSSKLATLMQNQFKLEINNERAAKAVTAARSN